MSEYATHWEDENGNEHNIKVLYDFQPYEPAIYYPNDIAHPGCAAGVEITSVQIERPFYDVNEWQEFIEVDAGDCEQWAQEILEHEAGGA